MFACFFMYSLAPVCFSTTYCGGQSVSNESLSFHQCCSGLSGVSFVSHGQCLLCPKGAYRSFGKIWCAKFLLDSMYDEN